MIPDLPDHWMSRFVKSEKARKVKLPVSLPLFFKFVKKITFPLKHLIQCYHSLTLGEIRRIVHSERLKKSSS